MDIVDSETRSRMMASVRQRDTKPERLLRHALHRLGLRYRLHDPALPGKPDLVFPRYRAVVFVHGCFWHAHFCRLSSVPASRSEFWQDKFAANRRRDARNRSDLLELGWRSLIVWQCAMPQSARDVELLAREVRSWLVDDLPDAQIAGSPDAWPRGKPDDNARQASGPMPATRTRRTTTTKMTHGLDIIARSIGLATEGSNGYAHGNKWQYHPRSDRHSKVACWAVMFDLLLRRGPLYRHVAEGKVAFGINHEMRDFQHDRKKDLDLVVCRRSNPQSQSGIANFAEMVAAYSVVLSDEERSLLSELPALPLTGVQTALVALEAKAAFTEFGKARPRLYDELNSSHLTIHGDTDQAIAVGLAMINASPTFVSPLRNPWRIGSHETVVNAHTQPRDTESTIAKVRQLPRRSATQQRGFDAVGVVVLSCANDGSPVHALRASPAPAPADAFHYDNLIERIDTIYAARFGSL